MSRRRKNLVVPYLVFIVSIVVGTTGTSQRCPIGFQIALTSTKKTYCYNRKPPEYQDEMDNECVGNVFASDIVLHSNLTLEPGKYWTEYKSAYYDGPLIDVNTGVPLDQTYNIPSDSKEYCSVVDVSVGKISVSDCKEKYPSYCLIKTYRNLDKGKCEETFKMLNSPLPACLRKLTDKEVNEEAQTTWEYASKLCADKGAALLQKAWIYANHDDLRASNDVTSPIPLGIHIDNERLKWIDGDNTEIPVTDWHFKNNEEIAAKLKAGIDNTYVALEGNFWILVPESTIFHNVLCEKPFALRNVNMTLYLTDEEKVRLRLSESLKKDQIKCYTDSVTFYPTTVEMSDKRDNIIYELKTKSDGYYWCTNIDNTNYLPTTSNKLLLHTTNKVKQLNRYAFKITLNEPLSLYYIENITSEVEQKLNEYLFVRNFYEQNNADSKINVTEEDLKSVVRKAPLMNTVLENFQLKRVLLSSNAVLVHANVKDNLNICCTNATWNGIKIDSWRHVYYCKEFGNVSRVGIGQIDTVNCVSYTCKTQDFNEGVFWYLSNDTDKDSCEHDETLEASLQVSDKVRQDDLTTTTEMDSANITIDATPTFVETPTTATYPTVRPPYNLTTITTSTTEAISAGPDTLETTTTALQPSDTVLEDIIDNLESALQNEVITLDFVNNTVQQLDNFFNTENDIEVPGRLLSLVETICERVDLGNEPSVTFTQESLAVAIANSDATNRVTGLILPSGDTNNLLIITDATDTSNLNVTEIKVDLPAIASELDRRISFIVFRDDRAFTLSPNASRAIVNSRILSVNMENVTNLPEGDYIDIKLNSFVSNLQEDEERACAYWDFDGEGAGAWSTEGCTLMTGQDGDFCRCTHLTHFAEIIAPGARFDNTNQNVLEVLSLIGSILSLFGLLMIALTGILFRSWRKDFGNKIWLNLSCAIFILMVMFLVVNLLKFEVDTTSCIVVGVLLHYAVLASFCWMIVAAALSYKRLVLVFTKYFSHKLFKASAFAWGVPALIIGILFAVDPSAYSIQVGENMRSFCYPSNLEYWLTVFLPIAVALAINIILFGLIVNAVFASRRIKRYGDTNEALRCASVSFLLVFLFGLPWVFGLFASVLIFAYLFVLTATLQGFVLFCFFILGNKKSRDLWLNFLHIKRKGKIPVTTSSYRSNNVAGTQSSNIMHNGNGSTVDTTPKSLSSGDDARFS